MAFGNGPRIVTDGLVLSLDVSDGNSYVSGSTIWNDVSGNRNNGTLTNGPIFDSTNMGSIVFDGTNDLTTFSGGTFNYAPDISGSISLEIWIYPTGPFSSWTFEPPTTNLGGFLGQGYFNSSIGWGLGMTSTSTTRYWAFQVRNGSTIVQPISENLSFNLNMWYHVVGSFNRNDLSRVYINGNLITSASSAILNGLTITPNQNDARIGAGGAQPFYSGCRISAARIYNRALSAQEVSQNYNATKNRFGL